MLIKRGGMPHPKKDADSKLDHALLRALLNHLSDSVLAIDSNFNILLANGAALSLLNKNELQGHPIGSVLVLLDKTGNQIEPTSLMTSAPDGYTSRDLRLRFTDGSTLSIFVSVSPVRLGYGQHSGGFIMIIRDITEERIIEDERNDFINVVGHELLNPVSIAEGSISNALTMAQAGQASESLVQSLKTAHEQTTFLANMINDLSVLSRADRGKLAMSVETFKVDELFHELSNAYTPLAEHKNLTIGFQRSAEATELTSSRLYVSEILQNLITNALRYTVSGGIQVNALLAGGGIQFRVTDTGIGINQSEQGKLFEKFFRGNDERVRRQNGAGLGLYITAKLAKLLGAKIEVKSELGTGSTFTATFPNLPPPSRSQEPTDGPQE